MVRSTRIHLHFIIAIVVALQRFMTTAAIDWQHVKPMYLVSTHRRMFDAMHQPFDKFDYNYFRRNNLSDIVPHEDEDLIEDEMPNSDIKASDRIFGGDVAQPLCFPYQVGMLLQRPRGLYWCGGSLISDEYILTAAHCVDMAKRALVFLGANEIKNAKEMGQVRIMVNRTSFIIYPTWNPRRLKDDIALVRLPIPIEFNERIHPISLPKRSFEYRSFENKLAIASGWGRYATGVHAISAVLRFVKLRIVNGHSCKRNYPLSYRSTNICTSGKNVKSTCNGDSGGPLVLQRKRSKERVLIGITSFGSIFGCDRGYPAAFTKVAAYLDWISDEAGVDPYKQDATLFRSNLNEHENLHDTLQCFEHTTEYESEEEDDESNEKEFPEVYHEHIQKYPDGTLLRTSFYNG